MLAQPHNSIWLLHNSQPIAIPAPQLPGLQACSEGNYSSIPQAQVSFSFCIWFSICLSPQIFTALTILIIHVSL